MEVMYISTHLAEASLMGALLLPMVGEDKVNQESRPLSKHQIVWTIPGNCRSGGIIDMFYFSQIRWPVSFFIFSQLLDHVHNHLVQSLYQLISLGMVQHGLQLFNAKDPCTVPQFYY